MNKLVLFASLLVSASLMTACGGGGGSSSSTDNGGDNSSGSDNGSGGSSSGGSSLSVNPVVPLNKVSYTTNYGNVPFETKAGYDGDIVALKESQDFGGTKYTFLKIKLRDSVPSLNIVDLKKTQVVNYNCSEKVTIDGKSIRSGGFKQTFDYKTGKVVSTGVGDGESFACQSTFQSPLPVTVSDTRSLKDLLIKWGDDEDRANASMTGLITTTCPQSEIDNDDADPERVLQEFINMLSKCEISGVTNYEITDDAGKLHKLAVAGSLPYELLLLLGGALFLRRKLLNSK